MGGIVQVVKYEGGPDVFAWKFPHTELGTWTQLIVNESQEAVLFKGGIACDVFQAGRHTLNTANIPILNNIINLPFGGDSPFSAEVWFVNKAYSLDIKWGTPTPVQVQDPKFKLFVPLRSYGQFGIRIENAKQFLIKLVGTLPTFDKTAMTQYFRGVYLTKVKDALSTYLLHHSVGILELNAHLEEISDYLCERLQPFFAEYGIRLVSFFVNDISVPEDDPVVEQLRKALAKRAEMEIIGYNYQTERTFDTLEGAAKNPGAAQAGLLGAGLGLGMGVGLGGAFGQQFSHLSQHLQVQETKPCPNCGASIDKKARFCSECGFDTVRASAAGGLARPNTVLCASCRHPLPDNGKFCAQCGKKYTPCSACKADLPEGAAACPTCGAEVVAPCPQCGYTPPGKIKFCPECGSKQE